MMLAVLSFMLAATIMPWSGAAVGVVTRDFPIDAQAASTTAPPPTQTQPHSRVLRIRIPLVAPGGHRLTGRCVLGDVVGHQSYQVGAGHRLPAVALERPAIA